MSPGLDTQLTDPSSSATKLWSLLRPLLLGLVLAGIIWATWRFDLVRYMSVAGMRELVDAHAPYGPLLFMTIVVAGLFTRLPMMGTVLVAVGAVLFGGLAAFAYGWLAALVGTTVIFVLVRSVARDYAKRMLDARPGRLRALDERITRNGFGTVLVLRLVFGMAPMLNWGLGLTGVRLLHCFAPRRPNPSSGELRSLRPVLCLDDCLCRQRRRPRGTTAGTVRMPSRRCGQCLGHQVPTRTRLGMEFRADGGSRHRPRHNPPLSPRAPPHLPKLGLARRGRGGGLRQLACPHYRAVRDCTDLRVASPRGGSTAQPNIWRELCPLPKTNRDDHPTPFLDRTSASGCSFAHFVQHLARFRAEYPNIRLSLSA